MCAVLQGLLGDARTFKTYYAKRIEIGNDKNATARDREVRLIPPGSTSST